MRNLITDYSFTADTRTIVLNKFDHIGIENIRLIVNETQKVVICSSMQKDNIDTISGNAITYVNTLPSLVSGDVLTIEVDMGEGPVFVNHDYIIEKKLDLLKPAAEVEPWDLTYAMGLELKPLVENASAISGEGLLQNLFRDTYVKSADLSSWTIINGNSTCRDFLYNCSELESIDFGSLETVSGDYALFDIAANCPKLKSIKLQSLKIITGSNTIRNFCNGCISLERLELPNLKEISCPNMGGQSGFAQNCTSLQYVDLSALTTINDQTFGYAFSGCAALTTVKIGYIIHLSYSDYRNPLQVQNTSVNHISDLTIYGTVLDSLWLGNCPLSFDSVYGIIKHIVDDPSSATGKTLTFKSGLSYQVTQSQKDDYDAAYNTLTTTLGWTVTNPPTVAVA